MGKRRITWTVRFHIGDSVLRADMTRCFASRLQICANIFYQFSIISLLVLHAMTYGVASTVTKIQTPRLQGSLTFISYNCSISSIYWSFLIRQAMLLKQPHVVIMTTSREKFCCVPYGDQNDHKTFRELNVIVSIARKISLFRLVL